VSSILFLLAVIPAFSQTLAGQNLVLNQPLEKEIKGGESQFFTVNIGANQTARVEIVQKGVDVSLAAYKPGGELFIMTESPSGVTGNDLILVTADEAGEYKISVEVANPKALLGKYTIKLAEIRPTVAQDKEINEAAKKINEIGLETSVLRQKGTREGRLQALEKFQEMIALSRIKQDKIWEIVAILSSGFIYNQLGEIQKSLDFYLRGLQLAREAGHSEYEGSALNNLGNSYKTLGDYEQSIFYLNQSLAIARQVGDKEGESNSLNFLGDTYLLLGDAAKAEQLLRQGLSIKREIKNQKGEGNILNNLGQVFAQSGDRAKALDFLQQALTLRQAIEDRQGEAISLLNLGKIFRDRGDAALGFENLEKSNRLARELGDRRVEADSFYWLAFVEKDKGNLPKAIENVENGLKIIEQIRGEIINPELRTVYFSTVQQFYELYTDLLVARYEKSKDTVDIALALEMSERARTRSLVELLQEANINIRQGVDVKMLEQAQDLQTLLNAKYRQRTQLLSRKAAEEQIAKITNEINSLTTELENLQVKIRRENPRYGSLTSNISLSAGEIRNLLDDETVLLEYKLGDARSFLWLVTKNSVKVFTLPARKEIEKTAKDFYAAVIARDKSKDAQTAELQKRLSEILLGSVASEIENKRLAIVADGVLQFIPFAALSSKNTKLLIETNEIVILPSAGVLAELRRSSGERKLPEKTVAVFADPIFEASDTRLAKNPSEKSVVLGNVLRDFNIGENLPRLLSSRVEARTILGFVPKNQVISNMDFDASRENAMSDALSNYRILHFATHGLLDTKRPEFSGLVFSLYDKNAKAQDGFLRLDQIYNLNLNSDLVVLSACQTALGKDVRGEGLIGLTRGFMYAGAKRVVASLWKVDDAATAEFMKRFYQNFLEKKLPYAAALRQTQNEMKQIPRFRSPYFWAGFTLQGDWK
jgi:CHAT domain-containing protein/Tfp pilus assembly protein PilF